MECVVAPLVGAWIEIVMLGVLVWFKFVAPLVGAWIEINGLYSVFKALTSLLL